jgi:hypothetical protein
LVVLSTELPEIWVGVSVSCIIQPFFNNCWCHNPFAQWNYGWQTSLYYPPDTKWAVPFQHCAERPYVTSSTARPRCLHNFTTVSEPHTLKITAPGCLGRSPGPNGPTSTQLGRDRDNDEPKHCFKAPSDLSNKFIFTT